MDLEPTMRLVKALSPFFDGRFQGLSVRNEYICITLTSITTLNQIKN